MDANAILVWYRVRQEFESEGNAQVVALFDDAIAGITQGSRAVTLAPRQTNRAPVPQTWQEPRASEPDTSQGVVVGMKPVSRDTPAVSKTSVVQRDANGDLQILMTAFDRPVQTSQGLVSAVKSVIVRDGGDIRTINHFNVYK